MSSCGQKMNTNVTLKNETDSISYFLGVDVANSLKNIGVDELNYDNFYKGLLNSFEEKGLEVEEMEMKLYLNKYFQKIREKQVAEFEQSKQDNLDEGYAFLEENKKREGVIVTESGLQYEIIEEGFGEKPGSTSIVVCNYKGTLLDGTEFDSSKPEQPSEFPLNRVITGWSEGLQLMKEGGKYRFFIPTNLAYGENVRPGTKIGPNMALIFEVELVEIKNPLPEENK